MIRKKYIWIFFLVTSIVSAILINNHLPRKKNISYSFIVAGHTYGKPGVINKGLHPPFIKKIEWIRKNKLIELGFFTGDIVNESNPQSWNYVDENIASLGIPIYFAPGNHDVADKELYTKRYAVNGKTYHSFQYKQDLFIVLDPNIDQWNISGDQLDFLKATLSEARNVNNIFVFAHQLIWWDNRKEFKGVKPNSLSGRGDRTNFWPEIAILLKKNPQNVYLFTGDVGARKDHVPVYYQSNNISIIASGMGGGRYDNFVVVNVHNDPSSIPVSFELKWLNRNIYNLFFSNSLEEWSL